MRVRFTIAVLSVLFLTAAAPSVQAQVPTWEEARDLLNSGKNAEAEAMLEQRVTVAPDDGLAWYGLGLARHGLGDLDGAIEADKRAAALPDMRAEALYNLACAYGLKLELEPASEALARAIDEGFLDFELFATDSDIEIVREAGRIPMPAANQYETIRAQNGVEIRYKVILPDGYDAKKTYPALVSFAPGGWGAVSCDWSLQTLWGESSAKRGWIAVHLIAPDRGWMTHPTHHALEELLDEIRTAHPIEANKFHLVGFGSGARPAATYSGMSGRYFQSLTTVSSRAFAQWDENDLKDFSQKHVFLIVGSDDKYGVQENRRTERLMREGKTKVTLKSLTGEGRVPQSMLDGGLMEFLDETVREKKARI